MNNLFHICTLILMYSLIAYCLIGIGMYICSKARPRKRTILLIQVLATVCATIFFIQGFDLYPEIRNHLTIILEKIKEILF